MTSQLLSNELTNLIQESKRKNQELRNAAEKSLSELKALPSTSEAQLGADLSRRPHFLSPFIIACASKNPKAAAPALNCIQRLIVIRGLAKERLKELLDSLKEATGLSYDVQLKLLQCLPSLLQTYAEDIRGELLFTVIQICSALQAVKTAIVGNTAAATLQQLLVTVYEKVAAEDRRSLEIPTSAEVRTEDGQIQVRPAAHDAFRVFSDICALTEGGKPSYVRFSPFSPAFGLELVEAILSNHEDIIDEHEEQVHLLKSKLMPFLIKSLSEKQSYSLTVRLMRTLTIILHQHLDALAPQCEVALGLLNHLLDPEVSPPWKRAMVMEQLRGVYADTELLIHMYALYDEREGGKSVIGNNLGAFVRLASEKPALIGIGQQSMAPNTSQFSREAANDQAVMEAAGAADVIAGAASVAESSVPGISMQWSVLRTPITDHLDKAEPPAIPETYIYALTLSCVSSVADGLAKFILPLTMQSEPKSRRKAKSQDPEKPDEEDGRKPLERSQSSRKKAVPVNLLSLEKHPQIDEIRTVAALMNAGWPAMLATCSTFMYATLDGDFYRNLVRAVQKLTQVAGLLRLSTPRDAFITTLSKASIPPQGLLNSLTSPASATPETPRIGSNPKGLLSVESFVSRKSDSADRRRSSIDSGVPTLSPRNMLCLRALLNLAIALGPTLEQAWTIIFTTLHQVDLVLSLSGNKTPMRSASRTPADADNEVGNLQNLNSEIAAAQAAATRLFDSTSDYPNDSFLHVVEALCKLLRPRDVKPLPASRSASATFQKTHQSRVPSMSGIVVLESQDQDQTFVLGKLGEIASANVARFIENPPGESGWDIVVEQLIAVIVSGQSTSSSRRVAAEILGHISTDTAISVVDEEPDWRNSVQERSFAALQRAVGELQENGEYSETDLQVHDVCLAALREILERCGETLMTGWSSVFVIISSVFRKEASSEQQDSSSPDTSSPSDFTPVISTKLSRSAFSSLQLICSDFLTVIPDSSITTLADILYQFCSQPDDLNISLTSITYFYNLSDFLKDRFDDESLHKMASTSPQDDAVTVVHSPQLPTPWLQLMDLLSKMTKDPRPEVRNAAIGSFFNTYDNFTEKLSYAAGDMSLKMVIFRILQTNMDYLVDITKKPVPDGVVKSWMGTTKLIIDGVARLVAGTMTEIIKHEDGDRILRKFLGYFKQFLGLHIAEVTTYTYNALTKITERIPNSSRLHPDSLDAAAKLWMDSVPTLTHRTKEADNQGAFQAYLMYYQQIHRLISHRYRWEDVMDVCTNLYGVITKSDNMAFSSDVNDPTPVQKLVLQIISTLPTEYEDAACQILKLLADLISLPFKHADAHPEQAGLTFVALSKRSMQLAEDLLPAHLARSEVLSGGFLTMLLDSLALPLSLKYKWGKEGRAPPTWRVATTAFVGLLPSTLKALEQQGADLKRRNEAWDRIVTITGHVAKAEVPASLQAGAILQDEGFDLEALAKIHGAILPALGQRDVRDDILRDYVATLFTVSLLFEPEIDELPEPEAGVVANLYDLRLGRTWDPVSTKRPRVAYFCLEQLFALVAAHDSPAPERVRLAQAATPHFLLRAALPIKGYTVDQPLRGRMPQPGMEKRELLWVLRGLRERREHLPRLHRLIVQALGVRNGVEEVEVELRGLLEVVGEGL